MGAPVTPPTPSPAQAHAIGDRVTRPVFIDDGTWRREGDSCLARSPLRIGTVEGTRQEKYDSRYLTTEIATLYEVEWDDGTRGSYFAHGIDAITPAGRVAFAAETREP